MADDSCCDDIIYKFDWCYADVRLNIVLHFVFSQIPDILDSACTYKSYS